ncbi:MAG: hypothetical protein KDA99_24235 [Planctomycetales bacterium]|nr:hypothetical protein [Planctomycetales bacterium]
MENCKVRRRKHADPPPSRLWGLGELSVVEHALCPLECKTQGGLEHRSSYWYSDRHRNRKKANVVIKAVDGLSPNDEFYLWGILGIIFSLPEPTPTLFATRNYILRRLGFSIGGENYVTLRQAMDRLAGASYVNDRFFDPVRGEHRQVSFGFLSYSLPVDPASSRGWEIAIDPIFFSLVEPLRAHFWFDLNLYRSLDHASRRLFLILKKVFHRSSASPKWRLGDLAVNVLGYSETLSPKDLRRKLRRCAVRLYEIGLIDGTNALFTGSGCGTTVQFRRSRNASSAIKGPRQLPLEALPIYEQWTAIGVDREGMQYLQRNFTMPMLQEWADITLAARERHGTRFFDRSMAAYYIDNVKAAKKDGRRPPDWWYEFRKREYLLAENCRGIAKPDSRVPPSRASFANWIRSDGRSLFESTLREILEIVQINGRATKADADRAHREAEARMWKQVLELPSKPNIST